MIIASFPETAEIGKKVALALKAHYTTIDVKSFPDSEFHLKLHENPNHNAVVILNSLSGEPNRKIIETILAGGVARDYHAKKVILVATYLPYMRQDKHFEKYDSFSAKHVMKLFDEFDKIIAIDPHLHRIHKMSELYSKAESISTNGLIADYIKKKFKGDFEIIGPDSESRQWDAKIAKMLGKKVVILDKTRLGDEEIVQKEKPLGNIKNAIMIDDIISTGRTLAGAIEMAKNQGAKKITCIGVHGVLVNGADELITRNASLVTTNTIFNKYAEIDVSPIIIEALKKVK
jgi:ribose-phosphate pyrophosphokinase